MQYPTSFVLPTAVYQDEAYNRLRRGYIILIASLLEKCLTDTHIDDHADMIVAIERSCYNDAVEIAVQELLHVDFNCPEFEHLYRTRIMRITKNMDLDSEVADDYLVTALLDGTVDPATVSKLDNKDLSPRHNVALLEELNTRLNQHVTLKTSSLYRCHKCGHRSVQVQQKQMRSLDEPSTLILTCTFCHYKWFS